ncbi:hypothetical protein KSP39_PZI023440 [Platanthera zijinensis]|uniref:Trichome birefringence-like N-terminal domain-containing protein n=1 Tax=Platanthera zijinensis TaxID=2320716 RepID=A0AAP0FSS6_9ASPA
MARVFFPTVKLIPSIPVLLTLATLILFSTFPLLFPASRSPVPPPLTNTRLTCRGSTADLTNGFWIRDSGQGNHRSLLYDASCPFHRNAWNCLRNARDNMEAINSWVWIPQGCGGLPFPRIDPAAFVTAMRGRRIGFVGDSLNENFIVAFLCTLRSADPGARKWKRKGAWRGGYFPKFDLTVAYHRSVLLAKYKWQPVEQLGLPNKNVLKGFYKVDVDIPADDWSNITKFYDVLVFNTGHWWGLDKFPEETPLVFYKDGNPIFPSLGILDGLEVVLQHMISYINKQVPKKTIKIWRSQSPRHFYGGEWNQNGSCLLNEPLKLEELDLWFDPGMEE